MEAEFDGRINQLYVAEGDKVSSGANLVQVVDFEHLQVSVRVDEYDISSVHAGDQCRVSTVATENTFTTVIDSINYVSSSSGSVAYYTATAYVDVAEGIYPGMQVTVTIPKEEAADVVILRETALSFDLNNQAFVYTMNAHMAAPCLSSTPRREPLQIMPIRKMRSFPLPSCLQKVIPTIRLLTVSLNTPFSTVRRKEARLISRRMRSLSAAEPSATTAPSRWVWNSAS